MKSKFKKLIVMGAAALAVSNCGSESNINGMIFVSEKQQESIDVLVSEAELAYDQGDFATAKERAEKAFAINTQNEKVAILLGYVYLSYAGVDPFQLAKSLITGSTSSKSTSSSSSTTSTSSSSSSSAAGQLGTLSSIISVTRSDLNLLGLSPCAEGVSSTEEAPCRENMTIPAAFESYPVLHPKRATAARTSGVAPLAYALQAVKTICPFVGDDLLIAEDPRHKRETGGSCEKSPVESKYSSKSSFLWAFAHIADALVLYNVLLYTNEGSSNPNIEERASLLKSTGISNITTYLEMVNALSKDISAIFQTDIEDSAINGVLNSLSAAGKAFGSFGSGAESFTAGIDKSLETLKSSASAGSTSQTKVLQSQLTSGATKQIASSMESLKAKDPENYAQNKTAICNQLTEMSGGQTADLPADCK
jgi:hypothetical protein